MNRLIITKVEIFNKQLIDIRLFFVLFLLILSYGLLNSVAIVEKHLNSSTIKQKEDVGFLQLNPIAS